MKSFCLAGIILLFCFTLSAQNFTYPLSGDAVNNQLATLTSEDGVKLVTTIRSYGCTPSNSSNFRFGTDHVSTGAIYRNTKWAAGCINSIDLIKFDFSSTNIRPNGLKFSIFDVDNGSDSVSVQMYSAGNLVDYSYTLYSPTFVSAHGNSPSFGFVGSENNNSVLDDNSGRIDVATVNNFIRIDSVIVYKYNGRDITGNPSQSFAGFRWLFTTPLPVKLISFNGFLRGDDLLFNWKVAEEIGTKEYYIEYSADGNKYFQAGESVAVKPLSGSESIYTHTIPYPLAVNVLYFRLVSEDEDGRKFYSKTIKISRQSQVLSSVYPAMFSNKFSLTVVSEKNTTLSLLLTNIDGRILFKKVTTILQGYNLIPVDINIPLKPGMYIVQGELGTEVKFTHKLIKN